MAKSNPHEEKNRMSKMLLLVEQFDILARHENVGPDCVIRWIDDDKMWQIAVTAAAVRKPSATTRQLVRSIYERRCREASNRTEVH